MTRTAKESGPSPSRTYRLLREVQQEYAPLPVAKTPAGGEADVRRRTLHCSVRGNWMSVIEDAFPYLERCIDEQRRFIQAHGEIVRVDQARKVDPESIRHLAQHSDFISRVDADGDVLPKQLMIIQREDSYAIYENRFLYTLVQQLRHFLEARQQEYQRTEGCTETKVEWFRAAAGEEGELTAQLCHTLLQSRETPPDDPVWQRLQRLRSRGGGLTLSPLMKLLSGVVPISPPVVRTNVMKKNVNFQRALALYEELAKMEPPFFTESSDQPPVLLDMPTALQSALEALTSLQRRTIDLLPTEECAQRLQCQLEAEDQRDEMERLAREEASKRDVEKRIEDARQREIERRRQEVAQWQARNAELKEENEALSQALETLRQDAEAQLTALREQMRLQAEEMQAQLVKLQAEKEAETAQLAQERAAHEQFRAEAERTLAAQQAEWEARLARQSEEAAAALTAQRAEWEARLARQGEESAAALTAQRAEWEARLARQSEEAAAALTAQRATFEAQALSLQREARKQAEQMQKRAYADLAEQRKQETLKLRQQDDAHQRELRQLRKTMEAQALQRQKKAAQELARQQKNWQAKQERARQRLEKERGDRRTHGSDA